MPTYAEKIEGLYSSEPTMREVPEYGIAEIAEETYSAWKKWRLKQWPFRDMTQEELAESVLGFGGAAAKLDFHPTQGKAIDKMVRSIMKKYKAGRTVTDPSAGKGNLLDALHAAGVPKKALKAIEISPARRKVLSEKGYELLGKDFLKYGDPLDLVIMNPPFSAAQFRTHIQHAYKLLQKKGKVSAIMPWYDPVNRRLISGNPWSRPAATFMEWLEGRSAKVSKAMKLPTQRGQVTGHVVEIAK